MKIVKKTLPFEKLQQTLDELREARRSADGSDEGRDGPGPAAMMEAAADAVCALEMR